MSAEDINTNVVKNVEKNIKVSVITSAHCNIKTCSLQLHHKTIMNNGFGNINGTLYRNNDNNCCMQSSEAIKYHTEVECDGNKSGASQNLTTKDFVENACDDYNRTMENNFTINQVNTITDDVRTDQVREMVTNVTPPKIKRNPITEHFFNSAKLNSKTEHSFNKESKSYEFSYKRSSILKNYLSESSNSGNSNISRGVTVNGIYTDVVADHKEKLLKDSLKVETDVKHRENVITDIMLNGLGKLSNDNEINQNLEENHNTTAIINDGENFENNTEEKGASQERLENFSRVEINNGKENFENNPEENERILHPLENMSPVEITYGMENFEDISGENEMNQETLENMSPDKIANGMENFENNFGKNERILQPLENMIPEIANGIENFENSPVENDINQETMENMNPEEITTDMEHFGDNSGESGISQEPLENINTDDTTNGTENLKNDSDEKKISPEVHEKTNIRVTINDVENFEHDPTEYVISDKPEENLDTDVTLHHLENMNIDCGKYDIAEEPEENHMNVHKNVTLFVDDEEITNTSPIIEDPDENSSYNIHEVVNYMKESTENVINETDKVPILDESTEKLYKIFEEVDFSVETKKNKSNETFDTDELSNDYYHYPIDPLDVQSGLESIENINESETSPFTEEQTNNFQSLAEVDMAIDSMKYILPSSTNETSKYNFSNYNTENLTNDHEDIRMMIGEPMKSIINDFAGNFATNELKENLNSNINESVENQNINNVIINGQTNSFTTVTGTNEVDIIEEIDDIYKLDNYDSSNLKDTTERHVTENIAILDTTCEVEGGWNEAEHSSAMFDLASSFADERGNPMYKTMEELINSTDETDRIYETVQNFIDGTDKEDKRYAILENLINDTQKVDTRFDNLDNFIQGMDIAEVPNEEYVEEINKKDTVLTKVGESSKKEKSPRKKSLRNEMNYEVEAVCDTDIVGLSKSRYGRTRKPKFIQDFISDRKLSPLLNSASCNYTGLHDDTRGSPSTCRKSRVSLRRSLRKTLLSKKIIPEESKEISPKVPMELETIGTDQVTDLNLIQSPPMKSEMISIENIPIEFQDIDPDITALPLESDFDTFDVEAEESSAEVVDWSVGDLVWAKFCAYPYWPCIVTTDPETNVHQKRGMSGRRYGSAVHVQFFGDQGRRCWVLISNLIRFESRQQFFRMKEMYFRQNPKEKIKQRGFFIRKRFEPAWNKGSSEAEEILHLPREERIEAFNKNCEAEAETVEVKSSLTKKISKKRKMQSEDSENQSELTESSKKIKSRIKDDDEENEKSIQKMLHADETIESVVRNEESSDTLNSSEGADKNEKKESILVKRKQRKLFRKKNLGRPIDRRNHRLFKKNKLEKNMKKSKKLSVYDFASTDDEGQKLDSKLEVRYSPEKSATNKRKNENETASVAKKFKLEIFGESFESFCEKFAEKVLLEHPELTEKEHERYLSRIWHTMEEMKNKSMPPIPVESPPSPSSPIVDSNEDISKQSNSSSVVEGTKFKKSTYHLFTDVKYGKVCNICEKSENVVRCRGPCSLYFHNECIEKLLLSPQKTKRRTLEEKYNNKENPEGDDKNGSDSKKSETSEDASSQGSITPKKEDDFRCNVCAAGDMYPCFICNFSIQKKSETDFRYRCSITSCGRMYHKDCLKRWPRTTWSLCALKANRITPSNNNQKESLTCPQHHCHTCTSDDPTTLQARICNDRLVRCIRCPTSYHMKSHCIPAGSKILSMTQIICPRHYEIAKGCKTHHFNTSWCFICATGGSLICCDECPTSFHVECIKLKPEEYEDGFVCEECSSGRFPLYGELVWVKLGHYRWWPAQIMFPKQVPEKIYSIPHRSGEFVVRFFGSHDHNWVNRGRVFQYHEGDSGKGSYRRNAVDLTFEKAISEAGEAHRMLRILKEERFEKSRNDMKPPRYSKIKTNKPVGNVRVVELNTSNISACECDPNLERPCAPDSDCINRMLLVECNPTVCPAGDRCLNQSFEKRLYPALKPYRTENRGWGLKALANIKKGDFVIEYVGEVIDEMEYKRRLSTMHTGREDNYYFLTIDKDRIIDAGPKGNVARFMNHSCDPNCETQKWTVNGDTRVGLFALKDIPMNTELVFNYHLDSGGAKKKPCNCGTSKCSGFIGVNATKSAKLSNAELTNDKECDKKNKKCVIEKIDSKLNKIRKYQKQEEQGNKDKVVSDLLSDNECFICNEGGELVMCDNKLCPRGYHLKCLFLDKPPRGRWLCPWHYCAICGVKRKVCKCMLCINSYCEDHIADNIYVDPDKGLVCNEHREEDSKEDVSAVASDVMQDTSTPTKSTDKPIKRRIIKKRIFQSEDGKSKLRKKLKRMIIEEEEKISKNITVRDENEDEGNEGNNDSGDDDDTAFELFQNYINNVVSDKKDDDESNETQVSSTPITSNCNSPSTIIEKNNTQIIQNDDSMKCENIIEMKIEPEIQPDTEANEKIQIIAKVPVIEETPKVLETLESPKVPVVLEIPKVTEIVDTPKISQILDIPKVTDILETPKPPETQNTPKIFEILNNETLGIPKIPKMLKIPKVPETLETQKIPKTLETQKVTGTLEAPKVPETLKTPKVPKISETAKLENLPKNFEVEINEEQSVHEVIVFEEDIDSLEDIPLFRRGTRTIKAKRKLKNTEDKTIVENNKTTDHFDSNTLSRSEEIPKSMKVEELTTTQKEIEELTEKENVGLADEEKDVFQDFLRESELPNRFENENIITYSKKKSRRRRKKFLNEYCKDDETESEYDDTEDEEYEECERYFSTNALLTNKEMEEKEKAQTNENKDDKNKSEQQTSKEKEEVQAIKNEDNKNKSEQQISNEKEGVQANKNEDNKNKSEQQISNEMEEVQANKNEDNKNKSEQHISKEKEKLQTNKNEDNKSKSKQQTSKEKEVKISKNEDNKRKPIKYSMRSGRCRTT